MKLKNKAQIEAWLEAGELDEVIAELKKQLKASKTGKELYSDALVLSAQLKKINADKMERLISYEHESLALNNFRRSLVDFLELIEKHEDSPTKASPMPPTTTKKVEEKEATNGFSWQWVLLPVVAIVIWLVFFRSGAQEVPINICTLNTMSAQGHCCNEDLPRISLSESHGVFYVTTVIEGDPIIQAMLFMEDGSNYPTQPIRFSYDMDAGDRCHSAMLLPIEGRSWLPGRYTFQLQLNGEVTGQKTFEIIN